MCRWQSRLSVWKGWTHLRDSLRRVNYSLPTHPKHQETCGPSAYHLYDPDNVLGKKNSLTSTHSPSPSQEGHTRNPAFELVGIPDTSYSWTLGRGGEETWSFVMCCPSSHSPCTDLGLQWELHNGEGCVCVCFHSMHGSLPRGQKRAPDLLGWELQAILRGLTWVLGIEHCSSSRVICIH